MSPRRRRAEPPGEVMFPGYRDIAEIGGGGFATVYAATEASTTRRVALKLLRVGNLPAHVLEGFDNELLALATFSTHPHIVTLYRSEPSPDGRPMLVLELCKRSAADRLREAGTLDAREVTAIGIKIAGALETAHRGGFLHRDLKPQNILETVYGEPALADFGVASLQASAQSEGMLTFTTLHAPPEVLEGKPLSPASDVYGLASTLYQLLSGHPPFAAFDGEAPAAVILRILRDPVVPLQSAEVPIELSDLICAGLAKEAADRPASAAEFAAGLQEVESLMGWGPTQFLAWDDTEPEPAEERRPAPPAQPPRPEATSAAPGQPPPRPAGPPAAPPPGTLAPGISGAPTRAPEAPATPVVAASSGRQVVSPMVGRPAGGSIPSAPPPSHRPKPTAPPPGHGAQPPAHESQPPAHELQTQAHESQTPARASQAPADQPVAPPEPRAPTPPAPPPPSASQPSAPQSPATRPPATSPTTEPTTDTGAVRPRSLAGDLGRPVRPVASAFEQGRASNVTRPSPSAGHAGPRREGATSADGRGQGWPTASSSRQQATSSPLEQTVLPSLDQRHSAGPGGAVANAAPRRRTGPAPTEQPGSNTLGAWLLFGAGGLAVIAAILILLIAGVI